MNDLDFDYLKVWGINTSVLASVSLVQVEMILKIVVLILTAVWTAYKIYKLAQDK